MSRARKLWGLSNEIPADSIAQAFGRRRITVDPKPPSVPTWVRQLGSIVVEIQTLYGEYGGPVGSMVRYETPQPDRTNLRKQYKKKKPKWSDARIDKAVDQILASSQKNDLSADIAVEQAQAISAYLSAMKELVDDGDFTLVLDDDWPDSQHQRDVETVRIGELSPERLLLLKPRSAIRATR